jgi:hypothetical protein
MRRAKPGLYLSSVIVFAVVFGMLKTGETPAAQNISKPGKVHTYYIAADEVKP